MKKDRFPADKFGMRSGTRSNSQLRAENILFQTQNSLVFWELFCRTFILLFSQSRLMLSSNVVRKMCDGIGRAIHVLGKLHLIMDAAPTSDDAERRFNSRILNA